MPRQLVPVAPGPYLDDSAAMGDESTLTLQEDFMVNIECSAGPDGVLTLTLAEPTFPPTEPSSGSLPDGGATPCPLPTSPAASCSSDSTADPVCTNNQDGGIRGYPGDGINPAANCDKGQDDPAVSHCAQPDADPASPSSDSSVSPSALPTAVSEPPPSPAPSQFLPSTAAGYPVPDEVTPVCDPNAQPDTSDIPLADPTTGPVVNSSSAPLAGSSAPPSSESSPSPTIAPAPAPTPSGDELPGPETIGDPANQEPNTASASANPCNSPLVPEAPIQSPSASDPAASITSVHVTIVGEVVSSPVPINQGCDTNETSSPIDGSDAVSGGSGNLPSPSQSPESDGADSSNGLPSVPVSGSAADASGYPSASAPADPGSALPSWPLPTETAPSLPTSAPAEPSPATSVDGSGDTGSAGPGVETATADSANQQMPASELTLWPLPPANSQFTDNPQPTTSPSPTLETTNSPDNDQTLVTETTFPADSANTQESASEITLWPPPAGGSQATEAPSSTVETGTSIITDQTSIMETIVPTESSNSETVASELTLWPIPDGASQPTEPPPPTLETSISVVTDQISMIETTITFVKANPPSG